MSADTAKLIAQARERAPGLGETNDERLILALADALEAAEARVETAAVLADSEAMGDLLAGERELREAAEAQAVEQETLVEVTRASRRLYREQRDTLAAATAELLSAHDAVDAITFSDEDNAEMSRVLDGPVRRTLVAWQGLRAALAAVEPPEEQQP